MVKEIFQEMVSSKTKSTSRRRYKVLFVAVAIVISLALCAGAVAGDACPGHDGWTQVIGTISSLPTGDYYLSDNVTLTSDLNINGDVQLCLYGYKLDLNRHHIIVRSSGNLSLYDCGVRVWQFNDDDDDGKWEVLDDGYVGKYSLMGGIITNGYSSVEGGGIYVEGGGNFTIYGGNIVGNEAATKKGGGGVCVFSNNGKLTMLGGNITGNKAGGTGGGLETSSTVIMYGGNITENTATGAGGGVCAWAPGGKTSSFTMYGGKIANNIAKGSKGGGVFSDQRTLFNMYGGEISENIVKGNDGGGGIYFNGNTLKINGTVVINGNTAGATQNNLYLPSKTITIDSGGIASGSTIYVTTQGDPLSGSGVQIATGASTTDVQYFFSDLGSDVMAELRNTNQIWLKEKPADPIDNFDNTTEHHNHPYGDTEQWHIWTGAHVVDPSVGGYYLLTEDVVLHDNWDVQGDTYLCLNGSVLDLQKYHITIPSGANLVICDCNSEVPHYFNAGSNPWVLSKSPTSNVVMGGVITNGEADNNGGGIFVDGGILTLDKGNIVGNKATTSGGGVFVATGTFTMNDGNIIGNKANSGGGGVENDATFIMTGGNISNNIVRDGGGVALWHNNVVDTIFTMTGGNITNNTGTGYGGGVFVGNSGSEFKITRGNITGNVAKTGGGGVYFKYGAMTISGSIVIKDNTLSGSGDDSNLYLYDKWRVATIEGTLNSDSEIWVKHPDTEQVNIASGASLGEENYFKSDDPVRSIDFNGGYIQLGPAISPSDKFPIIDHTHSEFPGAEWHEWNHTITEGPAIHHFDYYVLTDDITLTTDWVVPTGNTHLCLNGHVLNMNGNYRITIDVGANLTICDCKFGDPNHVHHFDKVQTSIKGGSGNVYKDPHFWVLNTSGETPNSLAGGVITNARTEGVNGGVIEVKPDGNLTITGGNIVGNSVNQTGETNGAGGSIYTSGKFVMYNGNITGNAAGAGGGGLQLGNPSNAVEKKATFIMYGGNVSDNYSPNYGGGITGWHTLKWEMHDGKIFNNTADEDGGGVFIERGTFEMFDGEISNNRAGFGGGVCVINSVNLQGDIVGNGYFNMSGGTITGNNATKYGGGLSPFAKATENPNTYGTVNLYESDVPIIINGNKKENITESGDIEYINCNVYIVIDHIVNINDGDVLPEGSYVSVKPDPGLVEADEVQIPIANSTRYENDKYFFADLPGVFEPFFDGDTRKIYLHSDESHDGRFEPDDDHSIHHPELVDITWYKWNNSSDIPRESGFYVLEEDITLTEDKLQDYDPELEDHSSRVWNITGEAIHLCLNGHSIDLNDARIRVSSLLIINDCDSTHGEYHFKVDEDGMWNLTTDSDYTQTVYGGIITGNHKPVERSDGASGFKVNEYGGGIRTINGTVIMKGGTIVGNKAGVGGGIYLEGGRLTLMDGSVVGNSAILGGGGVEVKNLGRLEMSGGVIANNTVTLDSESVLPTYKKGGGICLGVNDNSDVVYFTMSGGIVRDNVVRGGDGSGIFIDTNGKISVSGDATIHESNEVYINTLGKAIEVFGESFTGTALNISGSNEVIRADDEPIVTITDEAVSHGVLAEEINDQFVLNSKHEDLTIAVKGNDELIIAGKDEVWNVAVNVVRGKDSGTVKPLGYFNVLKNYMTTAPSYYDVKATANSGQSISDMKDNGAIVAEDVESHTHNLNLIDANRLITVNFTGDEPEVYTVTINEAVNGNIAINDKTPREDGKYEFQPMDIVNLTATYDRRYVSSNVTAKHEPDQYIDILSSREKIGDTSYSYNFTMPAADVIVNATFGLRGDADYDGDVCIVDAACVGVHIIRGDENKLIIPDTNGYFCANVNDVDGIDVYDLLEINRYLVGLIEYPGGPVMP